MHFHGRFSEKVCIVTGGGSGIGRATCERFAAEGGRVVVADLNDQHGQETVRAIEKDGAGEAIFVACGLYDLDRKIRPVGQAYLKLISQWRDILPTESLGLRANL
jgi:NAD(P)-dependent dehydrogenase (short-subunit alcohol dehydrogenase family)